MNRRRRQLALLAALLISGSIVLVRLQEAPKQVSVSKAKAPASDWIASLEDMSEVRLREIDIARSVTYNPPDSGGAHKPRPEPRRTDDAPPRTPDKVLAVPAPFIFYGYGLVPVGAPRRAFLTDGSQVFIVSEGDTLQGGFRVLCIEDEAVEIEKIATGQHSTLPFDADLAARSRNSA